MYTENELIELEQYFKTVSLTKEIQLTQCEMVTDVALFLNTSLAVCRSNQGQNAFAAAYNRLVTLKNYSKSNNLTETQLQWRKMTYRTNHSKIFPPELTHKYFYKRRN